MHKIFVQLFLVLLFGLAVTQAGAQEQNLPAEFVVGQTIVHTNPVGFGAEFTHHQRVNNWTDNPGMEAASIREYWEITDGGTDATGDYVTCKARLWDSVSSGFFDGADFRLYRENQVMWET